MKVAVRFTDGTKELLDDHTDADNTLEVDSDSFRLEYLQYIETLLRKKVRSMLFEVVVIAEYIPA